MDWKIDKGIWTGCILSPCLFNLYAEYSMQNARLDKSEAGIKTTRTNIIYQASLVAQMVKNPPAMWETWVQSLGWGDPLENEKATNSNILAWRIPWTEEPGGLQSMGSRRVWHNWMTFTFPASGSFPVSWLFASGDQTIGASASASVLPVNIQSWFPLGLTGLISMLSRGLLESLLQRHNLISLQHSAFFGSNSHIRTWLLEKT